MTTYVALLYSITLGQGRRVVMADLSAMAAGLGLGNPRTLIATGNLVFEAEGADIDDLTVRLEAAFEETFGRHVDIIVRDAAGWPALVAGNPFPKESETDAGHVIVQVMRRPVAAEAVAALEPYLANGEKMQAVGGDLWIHFARDIGHSKLAAAITPKRLGGPGTARNWNTIRRLGEMVG